MEQIGYNFRYTWPGVTSTGDDCHRCLSRGKGVFCFKHKKEMEMLSSEQAAKGIAELSIDKTGRKVSYERDLQELEESDDGSSHPTLLRHESSELILPSQDALYRSVAVPSELFVSKLAPPPPQSKQPLQQKVSALHPPQPESQSQLKQFSSPFVKAQPERGNRSDCKEVPPVPQYWRIEPTNVVVSAGQFKSLIDAFESALAASSDVIGLNCEKCKWSCQLLEGTDFVDFRARLFSHQGNYIVELQRREGDAYAFRKIFGQVVSHLVNQGRMQVLGGYYYQNGKMELGPVPKAGFDTVPFPFSSKISDDYNSYLVAELRGLLEASQTSFLDVRANTAKALAAMLSNAATITCLESQEKGMTDLLQQLVNVLVGMLAIKEKKNEGEFLFPPLLRYAAVALSLLVQSKEALRLLDASNVVPYLLDLVRDKTGEVGMRRKCLEALRQLVLHKTPKKFALAHGEALAAFEDALREPLLEGAARNLTRLFG